MGLKCYCCHKEYEDENITVPDGYTKYGICKECLRQQEEQKRRLEELKKQGGAFNAPFYIGQVVYVIYSNERKVRSHQVTGIAFGIDRDAIELDGENVFTIWDKQWSEYVGKFIFLTANEAVEALKELERNEVR